jgi:hypothetical protein
LRVVSEDPTKNTFLVPADYPIFKIFTDYYLVLKALRMFQHIAMFKEGPTIILRFLYKKKKIEPEEVFVLVVKTNTIKIN